VEADMSVKPDWAASVWFDADYIHISLPGLNGGHSHQIRVTNDLVGMRKLLTLIQARSMQSQLCSKGSPTQIQINMAFDERLVKRRKVKFDLTDEQRIEVAELIKELGI
jgi:hypothetical protein